MRLLKLICHAYRRDVPTPRDPKDLTPDQLEGMIGLDVEAVTGKPLDRGSVARNLAAMQQRLAGQLEEMNWLAGGPLAESDPEQAAELLAKGRAAITKTRELIASYETMLQQQN